MSFKRIEIKWESVNEYLPIEINEEDN